MSSRTDSRYETIPQQYGRLVSDSLPCPGVSLSQFLRQAEGQSRYYWESSRDSVAFAGSGTAIEIVGWGAKRFETIRKRAAELFAEAINLNPQQPLASPRLFGGFAFREDFIPDNTWWDFTPAHFVLPHYQLLRTHGETWLTINANVPLDEDPLQMREVLRAALQAKIAELQAIQSGQPAYPKPVHINYPMTFDTWQDKVLQVTDHIRRGELKKVVLSRVAEVRFDRQVDVISGLEYLAESYPETYRFLFEPRPFHAFYGATPELLVKVAGQQVETMALAGSIQRGKTPEEDAAYAHELLQSEKDLHEHQLVADEIIRRLYPLTADLQIGETGIMTLSNIQHIYTPVHAKRKDDSDVFTLVEALHPTPALGGDPRDIAMAMIQALEPVPRGWYAAPVGWVDQHMQGQFGVAIRSAVAQDKRVWMYAGAGIVAASEPQKEWEETALKFRPMLDALRIRDAVDIC